MFVLGRPLKAWRNIEIELTINQKGANWNENGTKSEPKGDQNSSQNQDEKSNARKDEQLRFWDHLVDLGSHFGAHWILNGSPNWSFSLKINIESQTRMSKQASWKIWFVDASLMPK